MRIVLLGKTGAGKSSLCNTMFGEDVFQINHCANTETRKCQKTTGSVHGKKITLIDTPGLFDTDRSEEELKSEIVKCITECSPGPHAFLILLKVEEFTGEEQEVITQICQYFSEEAFKYAVVVFTHGDQLPEGIKIEEFVRQNEKLSELVRKCGSRCHVFDNKYWKKNQQDEYRSNQLQVTELLNTIEEMVDKGGYYTNEMLQAVERKIQQEEESIRKSSPDMSQEEIREKEKRNVSNDLKKIVGVAAEKLTGNLYSLSMMIASFFTSFMRYGTGATAVEAPGGAVAGGYIGYTEADQADSVMEAAENTAKTVYDEATNMLNNKEQKQNSDLRIVLLGKTGAGKSSLCNIMFGEDVFKINHCANSETRECQTATRSVNLKKITVIDTPGLFDTNRSEEELKSEIVKCVTECSPGPHAFLILLKVEKYTKHEQAVITKIFESFSEEALKYAVVVFTHGDQLPEGMKIEEFFSENEKLRELVRKCGGRCHVFDNKHWKNNQQDEYRSNQFQVTALLNTIKAMVDTGGYYTNEMLQEVERRIQQEEERIRKSSPGMSEEEIREKAKRNVSNLLKKIVGVTTGVLLGALLGLPMMIASVVKAIKERAGGAVGVGLAGCAVAPAAGAVAGGLIGYTEADRAGSVKEAATNAAKAVFDTATNMISNKNQSEEKSPLL